MNSYGTALVLHALAATVWTGGHLVLALGILPGALRESSTEAITAFESRFERVGIPALFIQVATGLYLAFSLAPASTWLELDNAVTRAIVLKLTLLGATVALAAHARLRVIPHLTSETLGTLAWHIVSVTLISVAFVIIGVGYRVGLLS
ncbi:MAG: CopD family protein [Chromatocurvus sp.]